MSYKTKFFEWDVSPNYTQIGVPVGYEVECKVKSEDHLSYSLSTFRENSRVGHLSYSYDGETFYDFPTDETGKEFYTDYTMRFKITDALSGNTFVINDGIIYKTTSDLKRIIGKLDTGVSLSSISIDHITNDVYSLVDSTLLSFSTNGEIRFLKSFNLGESSLDVVIDGGRSCFWQICSDKIYKRDLDEADILTTYSLSSTLLSDVQTFLNKQNGNLVVSAQTSVGYEIFEFDFYSDTIDSDISSILILDIGQSDNGYFVTFGNSYLGEFNSGVLDETHVNTLRSDLRNISGALSYFYFSDFASQQLVKFSMPYSEEWEIDLVVGDGELFSRGNDISAIYSNNGKLFLCGDNGVTTSKLEFTNSSLFFGISGETNPSHVNFQYRSIYGTERLEQSSSSSSSSSSDGHSSSSSSSSDGHSESSSSSEGYSESSSSSSEGYSESSSSSSIDSSSSSSEGYSESSSSSELYSEISSSSEGYSESSSSSSELYSESSSSSSELHVADEFKLLASDGATDDWFGYSVAIDGNYAIVAAPNDDDDGSKSGSVYIYQRTAENTWGNETKLTASDGDADDWFGHSVSISGDYAIVGADQDDNANGTDSGAVYIYQRSAGNTWGSELKIIASDGTGLDRFGFDVSIDGDYAIVSAVLAEAVYIYQRSTGNTWGSETKLTASDTAADDYFGISVSISGDYTIVGASQDDDNGSNSGSVYIYQRSTGNTWGSETKLTSSDGVSNDWFGRFVSIDGDYVVVGDGGQGLSPPPGDVYIYQRSAGNTWGTEFKISAVSSVSSRSVSVSGDYATVGSGYVYERTSGNTWGNEFQIIASDWAADDKFGFSASIDGNYIMFGAFGDDNANGTDSGSAYIYRLSN